jgi:prepilin-type N-terminal cleavage/methylation domain-containing protein
MYSRRSQSAPAFTLVEVMVTVAIAGIILGGVIATNLQLMRSGVRITYYTEIDSQVRMAIDRLGHDAKLASAITWNGDSDVTFTLPLASGDTMQVTYAWNDTVRAFFVVPGPNSNVTQGRIPLIYRLSALAGGTAPVTFARYDRDGNVATTDAVTKRIELNLTVSRGSAENTGRTREVTSASFTMRNKPIE